MTRLPRPLLALLCAGAVLAGCGEKAEPGSGARGGPLEPLTLMLDYFPNADHAGLYAAQAGGEFRRSGLDVRLQAPPDPSAPLKLLQAGRADVAISYTPEVLLARDKGADLVVVGALAQRPLTSLIALGRSGVRRVQDLEGKRVGTAGIPYQSAYLRTILRRAGVDPATVRETSVGFNLTPAMLSGRVDATLGSFWNYEGVDLQRRGRAPVVLRMERLGVPTYPELVFVVRRETLDEKGANRVRRLLQAIARGHRTLREAPERGIDALLDANPDLERGLQTAVVERTLPVFFPEDADRPFGWIERDAWTAYVRWMLDEKLLKRPPGSENAGMTTEFLPGEGLEEGIQELQR
jgi:putative hydroxymethylpyrimidine transport system substrate-binding protein